ncbi:HNH endonuclease signature motif containing protein [Arenimonas sp.]|uniref:HNH endonuclease n=1 Tax=Arenimonas sp. TaxID=1872635 RepID=UPI002E341075|nr:HNH endonuclease signature motif containing protein [Arenimonas sp.]HEX4853058.1 HNH endonuclease signature motif containing protein [Arenimonas sp.]
MDHNNIPSFTEGKIYKRGDIHDKFGGSRQSGISASRQAPAIFIFTGESGKQYGYEDSWDAAGQVFTYTGEGTEGDMTMTGGNAAIHDHVADGRALHLFEAVPQSGMAHLPKGESRKGYCRYVAEMQCAGFIVSKGLDKKQTLLRDLIQFQLVRVGAVQELEEKASSAGAGTDEATQAPQTSPKGSLADLRARAKAASTSPTKKSNDARRTLYERSQDVVRYALARASGVCEGCGGAAPFARKDGTPYLEVHHVDRVSDGGLDLPQKVAAICPTCHRMIHHGADGSELNDQLRIRIAALEAKYD